MELFILIIVLGMAAIGIYFGCRVLKLKKRVGQLQADRNGLIEERNELKEERAKQSDQLRQKGIEIDALKKELDKYSDVEIKVALTSFEKEMLLSALDMPQFKTRVQDPKTKFFIRKINKELREKIKDSIKE